MAEKSTPNFEMTRAESGGIPILRLKGKLTLGDGSRALRSSISDLAAEGHRYLLLDLSELSYVDSSGLGTMVAAYNSVKVKGGAVGLFQVPPRTRSLLEMSGLTAIFKLFDSEQEAVSGVRDTGGV